MRTDQYIGLNAWARKLVSATHIVREVGYRTMPNGITERFDRTIEVPIAKVERIGEITGVWNDIVGVLNRYTLPTGEVYEEYLQAAPWCGGPRYHVALKDAAGAPLQESLWTDEEMGSW